LTAGAGSATGSSPREGGELALRLASAIVLAAIALAGAWFGGWPAACVVALAVVAVHLEWASVTGDRIMSVVPFAAVLVVALMAATAGYRLSALAVAAALVVVAYATSREPWRPAGVAYAAVFGFGVLLIRLADADALAATVFLLAVVWATDTGAFFIGRLVGGPKLWPRVSPGKTWSGAAGGLIAGVVAGIIVAVVAGMRADAPLLVVAAALSVMSQAGDLFESWVKRRFGAKDSSWIIPGHGGFMDRVDGLIFAAGLAVIVGWLHGGAGALAQGLIAW